MIRQAVQKIGWRLFSLVAAFALWITFVASPESVTSVSAPIEYKNMPRDLEAVSELPQRVHLEVRGPSARLRSASPESTAVVINLDHLEAGERTFTLDAKAVDLPAGLRATRIIPSQIRLRFERRTEAHIPINVRIAVPPPAGYRIVSTEVTPPELAIQGPESRVRQATRAETDPLDLSREVGTARFRVHVFLDDPQVRFVSPAIVQVSITIEKVGEANLNGKATVRH